jgi:DNA-binding sugar fermentation-stimulating protein
MEKIIHDALVDTRIRFIEEGTPGHDQRLDFHLVDHGVHIEVKRLYTERVAEQMATQPDIIVAQGERAVRLLARAIRSGLLEEDVGETQTTSR